MPLSAQIIKDAVNAYEPDRNSYISDLVFPRCPLLSPTVDPGTAKVTGKARRISRYQNIGMNGRKLTFTPGSRPQRIRTAIEEFDLTCERTVIDHAMDEEAWNALPDTIGPSTQAQIITPLGMLITIAREQRFAEVVTDTSNWTDGYTGSAGNRWTDDSFNALQQMQDAISDFVRRSAGMVPNGLMLTVDAYYALINNPYVKQLYGLNFLDLNPAQLMARLENAIIGPFNNAGGAPRKLNIVVSRGTVDDTNPAATADPQYIMENYGGLYFRPDTANPEAPVAHEENAAGKTYFYGGMTTKQYLDDNEMAIVNRVYEHATPQLFDANLFYYFSDIVGS